MKVLFVGRSDLGSFGGIQTFIRGLIEQMRFRSVSAAYLQMTRGSENRPLCQWSIVGGQLRASDCCRETSLSKWLAIEAPDIIHGQNLQTRQQSALFEIQLAARALGARALLTVHDVTGSAHEREALLGLTGTVIATQSEYNRQRLQTVGLPLCELLRVGIRFSGEFPKEPTGRLTICYPARLAPDKGARLAVQAIGQLTDSRGPVTLILSNPSTGSYGQTPEYIRELETLAARYPRLNLRYTDPASDAYQLYAGSSLTLVCPARSEGFGLVPLESLALGRPVVAYLTGGMREWMSGLEGVAEVPLLQANAIADTVTAALDRLRTLQEGALRARERLRLRYDIGTCADEHINLYRRASLR